MIAKKMVVLIVLVLALSLSVHAAVPGEPPGVPKSINFNVPLCGDGEQNGDETGIDCGGSCAACPVVEQASSPTGGGGGGGSSRSRCVQKWECTAWSACDSIAGYTSRDCTDVNDCVNKRNVNVIETPKPLEADTCETASVVGSMAREPVQQSTPVKPNLVSPVIDEQLQLGTSRFFVPLLLGVLTFVALGIILFFRIKRKKVCLLQQEVRI
jgi:hypothetical protein